MSAIDRSAELPAEPTPAELVRSVLAAARSLTLTTDGHRVELVGLHTLRAPDELVLSVPAESHLAEEIAATPEGALAATVEFTDVAPVAVPDRVRVRLPFPTPLCNPAHGVVQLRTLLARARRCPRRSRM